MGLGVITRDNVTRVVLYCVLPVGLGIGIAKLHYEAEYSHLFVISTVVLAVSCWGMQRMVGVFNLRCMTIPGFWYLTYLARIFIPSFFVFFDVSGESRYTYLFAVQSVLITVPLGILFVNMLLRFRRAELHCYFESPIQEQHVKSDLYGVCLIGLCMALGVTILYVSEVDTIPLFQLVSNPGDYLTLVLLREDSFKLLESPLTFVYALLRTVGFPFLILVTLGYYLHTKRSKWLILLLASLASGIGYAALTTEKAPVAEIVVLIFLLIFLYRKGRIGRKTIAVAVALALTFPVTVTLSASSNPDANVLTVLTALGGRIFYAPAEVLYWYFELFPGDVGYLFGRSIGKLAWLMGWDYFNTPNYVGLYGLRSDIESVHANGAFIGNLNADFGIVGVLLGGVLVGILVQGMQILLVRSRKTILNLVIWAYLILAFWKLHSTALPVVLVSEGVILILVLPRILRTGAEIFRPSTVQVATP